MLWFDLIPSTISDFSQTKADEFGNTCLSFWDCSYEYIRKMPNDLNLIHMVWCLSRVTKYANLSALTECAICHPQCPFDFDLQ